MTKKQPQQRQVSVQYAETSSLYGSQFLINATGEDVTIGFSSGYISTPGSKETVLPVHTRIATTLQGAKRLHDLLGKVIKQAEVDAKPETLIPDQAKAKLPKM